MVLSTKRGKNQKCNYKRQMTTTGLLGVVLLIVPVVMIYVDPILIIAKYKLRITKGSMIYDLLLSEMEGARLAVYLFNITNAEEFEAGVDHKLKVKEVGPFVYQEYRTNTDLEFDTEAEVVRFKPRIRTEFIPEESIGDPKDFILTLPNISFMSSASLISPYSYMVRQLFNIMAGSLGSKATFKIDVHSYLWWFDDPLVLMFAKTLPGLVYYDGTSILERLYDEKAVYTVEMSTNNENKFQVRTVHKTRREKMWGNDTLMERTVTFNDTYEGAAFPAGLTPETPINLYRVGLCKAFGMQYIGEKDSELGSKAFAYQIDHDTFINNHLCFSNGECPYGFVDLSPCWFNLPVALSKTHLLDADPKLLDRIEGLNPDKEKHSSYVLIDPKIGLTISTSMAVQLNLVLGDLSFNNRLHRFSNMAVPVAHATLTLPELPEQTKSSLSLMYVTGPRILLGVQIACCLIGTLLLASSIRLVYCNWIFRNKGFGIVYNPPLRAKVSAEMPLVDN